MEVYRFDIRLADDYSIKRVIDIPADWSFEDFHLSILSSIDFQPSELASFYISDKDWNKKQEITLTDMGDEDNTFIMRDLRLKDLVQEKGACIVYVYDFVLMWTFNIELTDLVEARNDMEYPILMEEEGKAPQQFKDKNRYPDEISDEDQQIIEQLKQQGLNFSTGFEDDYNDEEDEYWNSLMDQ